MNAVISVVGPARCCFGFPLCRWLFDQTKAGTVLAAACVLFSIFPFVVIPSEVERPPVLFGRASSGFDPAFFPHVTATCFLLVGLWYLRSSFRLAETNGIRGLDRHNYLSIGFATPVFIPSTRRAAAGCEKDRHCCAFSLISIKEVRRASGLSGFTNNAVAWANVSASVACGVLPLGAMTAQTKLTIAVAPTEAGSRKRAGRFAIHAACTNNKSVRRKCDVSRLCERRRVVRNADG